MGEKGREGVGGRTEGEGEGEEEGEEEGEAKGRRGRERGKEEGGKGRGRGNGRGRRGGVLPMESNIKGNQVERTCSRAGCTRCGASIMDMHGRLFLQEQHLCLRPTKNALCKSNIDRMAAEGQFPGVFVQHRPIIDRRNAR